MSIILYISTLPQHNMTDKTNNNNIIQYTIAINHAGAPLQASIDEMVEFIKDRAKNNEESVKRGVIYTSGFEVLTGRVHPYYDFDGTYDTEEKRASREYADYEQCTKALLEIYPEAAEGDILSFGRCGKKDDKFQQKESSTRKDGRKEGSES